MIAEADLISKGMLCQTVVETDLEVHATTKPTPNQQKVDEFEKMTGLSDRNMIVNCGLEEIRLLGVEEPLKIAAILKLICLEIESM